MNCKFHCNLDAMQCNYSNEIQRMQFSPKLASSNGSLDLWLRFPVIGPNDLSFLGVFSILLLTNHVFKWHITVC